MFDLIDTIPVRKRLSPSYRISRNELLQKNLLASSYRILCITKSTHFDAKKTAIACMVIRAVKSPFAYFRQGLTKFFRLFSNTNGLRRGGSAISFFKRSNALTMQLFVQSLTAFAERIFLFSLLSERVFIVLHFQRKVNASNCTIFRFRYAIYFQDLCFVLQFL